MYLAVLQKVLRGPQRTADPSLGTTALDGFTFFSVLYTYYHTQHYFIIGLKTH